MENTCQQLKPIVSWTIKTKVQFSQMTWFGPQHQSQSNTTFYCDLTPHQAAKVEETQMFQSAVSKISIQVLVQVLDICDSAEEDWGKQS